MEFTQQIFEIHVVDSYLQKKKKDTDKLNQMREDKEKETNFYLSRNKQVQIQSTGN